MKNKVKLYRFFLGGVLLTMALSIISCGGSDSTSNHKGGGLDINGKREAAAQSLKK